MDDLFRAIPIAGPGQRMTSQDPGGVEGGSYPPFGAVFHDDESEGGAMSAFAAAGDGLSSFDNTHARIRHIHFSSDPSFGKPEAGIPNAIVSSGPKVPSSENAISIAADDSHTALQETSPTTVRMPWQSGELHHVPAGPGPSQRNASTLPLPSGVARSDMAPPSGMVARQNTSADPRVPDPENLSFSFSAERFTAPATAGEELNLNRVLALPSVGHPSAAMPEDPAGTSEKNLTARLIPDPSDASARLLAHDPGQRLGQSASPANARGLAPLAGTANTVESPVNGTETPITTTQKLMPKIGALQVPSHANAIAEWTQVPTAGSVVASPTQMGSTPLPTPLTLTPTSEEGQLANVLRASPHPPAEQPTFDAFPVKVTMAAPNTVTPPFHPSPVEGLPASAWPLLSVTSSETEIAMEAFVQFSGAPINPVGALPASSTMAFQPAPNAAVVAHQIATALQDQANDPGQPIELALDPPELGRVRMHMAEVAGVLTLTIHAERPETAELMRRHMDLLAREFADAGVDSPNVNISGNGAHPREQDPDTEGNKNETPDGAQDTSAPGHRVNPANQSGVLDLRL